MDWKLQTELEAILRWSSFQGKFTWYYKRKHLNHWTQHVNSTHIRRSLDTGRKLNAYKTFRRRPGHLLNVLRTFDLSPVPSGGGGIQMWIWFCSSNIPGVFTLQIFLSAPSRDDLLWSGTLYNNIFV